MTSDKNKDCGLLIILMALCFITAWRMVSCDRYVHELQYSTPLYQGETR